MRKKTLALCIMLALGGCAKPQLVYRPIPVPKGLTQTVIKPTKPNSKTATQKDVGIFLIEQNAALDSCNARLQMIRKWSQQTGRSKK